MYVFRLPLMAYVDHTGLVILQLMISLFTLDSALQICLVRYIYIYVTFDAYWDKLSSSVAVGMNLGIKHDKKKLLKNNRYLFQKFTISCFSFIVI